MEPGSWICQETIMKLRYPRLEASVIKSKFYSENSYSSDAVYSSDPGANREGLFFKVMKKELEVLREITNKLKTDRMREAI